MSRIRSIERASALRFQLEDPEQAAVNEQRPADEQQALDNMLYDPTAKAPKLRPLAKRLDDKTPLRLGDARAQYEHALDLAPRLSKLVRTDKGAVLATPAGTPLLPPFDPAQQLPVGAKVVKLGEGSYRCSIPNEIGTTDDTEGASVIALIVTALHRLRG